MKPWSITVVLVVSFLTLGVSAVEAGAPATPGPLWPKAGVSSGPQALQAVAPSPAAKTVLAAIRGYPAWPHFAENPKPKRPWRTTGCGCSSSTTTW